MSGVPFDPSNEILADVPALSTMPAIGMSRASAQRTSSSYSSRSSGPGAQGTVLIVVSLARVPLLT
jgi:hypothetical protein